MAQAAFSAGEHRSAGMDGLRAISSTVSPFSSLSMCATGMRHWITPGLIPKPGWRLQWFRMVSPVIPTLRPPLAGLQKPPVMDGFVLVAFSLLFVAEKWEDVKTLS
jgi:hypothetical protein